jgi:hypothetical protein
MSLRKMLVAALAVAVVATPAAALQIVGGRPSAMVKVTGDWASPDIGAGIEVGVSEFHRALFTVKTQRSRIVGGSAGRILYDHFKVFDPDGVLIDSGVTRTEFISPIEVDPVTGFTSSQWIRAFYPSVFYGHVVEPYNFVETLADGSRIKHAFEGNLFLKVEVDSQTAPFTLVMRAVPEPSTWALMIAGFGLAGCFVRRSRRLAQPATLGS